MGFFFSNEAPVKRSKQELSVGTMHKFECKVCPLNNADVRTPHMAATGTDTPDIYVLGEAPGAEEDKEGRQFVGKSGQLLRQYLPKHVLPSVRWNNVVRTRPPGNRTPEFVEIECCRPSVMRDIAASKPKIILGFGNIPLHWALGETHIMKWRGRRAPVNIGGHACWYYPMLHPSNLLRKRRKDYQGKLTPSDEEEAFGFDMRRAVADLEDLPDPIIHTEEEARAGISLFTGAPGDLERLNKLLHVLAKERYLGIDIETNTRETIESRQVRPFAKDAKIVSAALAGADRCAAIALNHKAAKWPDTLAIFKLLIEFLNSVGAVKIAHNLSFELEWLEFFAQRDLGLPVIRQGRWADSRAQAYVLDERSGSGIQTLNSLCKLYFGIDIKALSNLDLTALPNEPIEEVLVYNGIDAKYCRGLFIAQQKLIKAEGLVEVAEEQHRRIPTLVLTQMRGVKINQEVARQFATKFKSDIVRIEAELAADPDVVRYKQRRSKAFSPSSNPDVQYLFERVLGTKLVNEEGNPSTDESVLAKVDHPVAKLILEYREIAKLKSTYVDGLLPGGKYVFADGRMHPNFNSTSTDTRRLSCTDPNGQNWPKREHKEIRSQAEASPGNVLVSIDYGQIEARVIGMASKDKVLCEALWTDYDIHGEWAQQCAMAYSSIIGGKKFLSDKAVMKKLRDKAKNKMVFPAFFGSSLRSIANGMGMPIDVMKPLYNSFWKQFSGVYDWQQELQKFFKKHGYVETLNGFRRHAPIGWNQLINMPIQGTAAEIVVDGMNRVSELAQEHDLPYMQPVLNIHDDLTFDVPKDVLDDAVHMAVKTMISCEFPFINVPLSAEVSVGPNWYEQKEIGKFFSNKPF